MAKKSTSSKRLPKAPLAEVVFELRWALQSGPGGGPVLHADPGTLPLLDAFSTEMKRAKWNSSRDFSHPMQTGPYGVVRRFYRNADSPFPIMQVGVGIFAANASTEYEYTNFRTQALSGVRALLASYPKMDFFAFTPNLLELRYVDVFDQTALAGQTFIDFLNNETTLRVGLPTTFTGKKVTGTPAGRLGYDVGLKGQKNSRLIVDVASAKNTETQEDVVRMQTTVRTIDTGVPRLKSKAGFVSQIEDWLDFAHDITSPLFKEIVSENVMQKFREL